MTSGSNTEALDTGGAIRATDDLIDNMLTRMKKPVSSVVRTCRDLQSRRSDDDGQKVEGVCYAQSDYTRLPEL